MSQKISIVRGLSTRAFGRIDVPGHADTANDSTPSWDSNIDAVDPGPADGRLATSHARWGCASSTAPSTPAWPPPCTPWRARRHARTDWPCTPTSWPKTTGVASLSAWDGAVTASGHCVDFASADFFRIEDGVATEHWDTVDYVRLYQSFGLLPDEL